MPVSSCHRCSGTCNSVILTVTSTPQLLLSNSSNFPTYANDIQGTELGGAWPAFCPALPDGSPTISPRTKEPTLTPSAEPTQEPTFGGTSTVGGGTTSPSPTLMATSMSYDSSLSISTVTTTITANTKAGKGKASKVTKGAKAA